MGPESGAGESGLAVVIAARNEGERIAATVAAVRATFPGAAVWVADDASSDGTAAAARAAGAQVVGRARSVGKGGNATAAAAAALGAEPAPGLVLLCDGDLGESAAGLAPLVEAVAGGECDLAVAAFAKRVGGGFGLALRFARWAIRRRCGFTASAPISGQRALRADALRDCLPFAPRFGMEIGMTIDAVRAGYRVREYELDLAHRATGRDLRGFLHRAVQLRDFVGVYADRRVSRRSP